MNDCELLVVGGGINGVGIARDAAGRGVSVCLVERDDLAAHTSSASTKLIHGGLRYLEQYEFRLVREALAERERLLAIAPHIIRPMRFVLPYAPGMRPRWLLRLGLFVYDHLERRERLAASRELDLHAEGHAALDATLTRGFEYSDCWVEDSRLVVLTALDAAERGARILTRTSVVGLQAQGDRWIATCRNDAGVTSTVSARAVANAAGTWVDDVVRLAGLTPRVAVRRVKGSHLIFPRLFEGEHAYLLQGPDRRVVFLIPFEGDFTLVGTTDLPFTGDASSVTIDADEAGYLCDCANRYLARKVAAGDAVGAYAGVRALVDGGEDEAQRVSRDYRLELHHGPPPLMSVYGGKITTHRRLAEQALELLMPTLGREQGASWTATQALPGGDIAGGDLEAFERTLRSRWPGLGASLHRFTRTYGTRTERLLRGVRTPADLGEDFGLGLTGRELDYLYEVEWARTAEDVLWRRTRLGLRAPPAMRAALDAYFSTKARSIT